MAVNKNFVVKNGLEVNTKLILADATNQKVGIGSTAPKFELEVAGGIGATSIVVTGVSTLASEGGITTTGGDLYVCGDLYVKDDITYDQVSGREINITGLGTIAYFHGTTVNVSGATTIAGLTSVTDVVSSGIVTADSFYGDGSNLTGVIAAGGGAIGLEVEGTLIGTGVTQLNLASSNGSAWSSSAPSSGVATATVTPGASIGLAIALGG